MRKIAKIILIGLCLCACERNEQEEPIANKNIPNIPDREYEPFGNISAEDVKKICDSYAERFYPNEEKGRYVYLRDDLGIYNDIVYIDILQYCEPHNVYPQYIKEIYLNGTYICSLPDPSYDINVWIKGDKSYSLSRAYANAKINSDIVKSVIENAEKCGIRYSYE